MTDASLWCESTESRDMLDNSDAALIDEPTEKNEANEPTLPIESTEPMLPIDSTEPVEPIDRNESLEAIDHLPVDPRDALAMRPA